VRIREDRDRTFLVPKALRHSLTKYGGFIGSTGSRSTGPKNGLDDKILVRKTLLPFPYMLSGSLCRYEALCDAIEKFYRPAPPSPFPL
jgi:hypothetical protein